MATVEEEAVPSCSVFEREGRRRVKNSGTVIHTDSRKGMIMKVGTRWKENGTQRN